MIQAQRHQQILTKLNVDGQVRVKDLSQEFEVTEDCIRKDLTLLEQQGLLKRVHGGATSIRENVHVFQVNERMDVRIHEKQLIAQKAIEEIKEGMTIFLGISTVTLEIAKLIYQKQMKITLVTNMIDIMQLFRYESPTRLIFLGGDFNQGKDGFLGTLTIEQMKMFHFDVSFIGVVGIDMNENRVTTYDMNDGLTKKQVIVSSKKSYMVAETAKLGMDGNFVFAKLEDFTGYIAEKELSVHFQKICEEKGCILL